MKACENATDLISAEGQGGEKTIIKEVAMKQ